MNNVIDDDFLKTIVRSISTMGVFLIILGLCFVFNGFKIMSDSKMYANNNPILDIYVSPSGIDTNNGTSTSTPLKTITKALVLAKNNLSSKNVRINLVYGNYEITSPIEINNAITSHENTLSIIGNGSTISGGTNISKSKTWTQNGNIWSVDISDYNLGAVPDFWVDGVRMPIAQEDLDVNELLSTSSSNRNYLPHITLDSSNKVTNLYFLSPSSGLDQASLSSDLDNLWFEYHWSFELARFSLSSIVQDGSNLKYTVSSNIYSNIKGSTSTYGMYSPNNETHINNSGVDTTMNKKGKYIDYTIKNAYSLMNKEGEYYYNRTTKKLYYYTSSNPNNKETVVSRSDGLFKIEGEKSNLVSNVSFSNLIFKYGTNIKDTYLNFPGDQADVLTYYDASNGSRSSKMIDSQIFVKYASNINFDHCNFENLGSNAVAMDSFVYNSSIENSVFNDIGASAVRVGTLDRKNDGFFDLLSREQGTLPPDSEIIGGSITTSNYFPVHINIENNYFHKIGYKHISSPALFVTYAYDVDIKKNKIEDTAYSGISLGWGWHNHLSNQNITAASGYHEISNNHLTNVVNRVVDGGAIYHLGFAGNSTTSIHDNFINTVESEKGYNGGIYLDEGTDNVSVYNNFVLDCVHWIGVRKLLGSGDTINYSTILQTTIRNNYANSTLQDNSTAVVPPNGRFSGISVNANTNSVYSQANDSYGDISNGKYTGVIVDYQSSNVISDNVLYDTNDSGRAAKQIRLASGYTGVIGAASNIILDRDSASINVGDNFTLSVFPVGTQVSWSSSNSNVATVDANGKVTGVASGDCVITATTTDGKKATCSVNVSTGGSSQVVNVTGVTLNQSSLSVTVGSSATLSATVSPNNATNKSVTWASSNNNVATVDANGKVTGVSAGNATITVTTVDGAKTATCAVSVTSGVVSVTGVTLNKSNLSVNVGSTANLTATVSPNNATNKNVTWTSSNTSVATVDANGKVTGVSVGNATITVTTADGSKTATCSVVVKVPVSYVVLNKNNLSLPVGENETLSAVINPNNATNKNVTWTSSKSDIASVDENGKVTAKKEGETVITVTTEDGSKTASCTVTVTPEIVHVTSVKINHSEVSIAVGGRTILLASVLPENATNKNGRWSSSNTNVATVDENGIIVGVSEGEAIITATTEDGGKTATCRVTVSNSVIPVTALELDSDSISIEELGTTPLKYTLQPNDATNKSVIIKSTNPQVVKVDDNGVISGVSEGVATLIVTSEDGLIVKTCQVTVQKRQENSSNVVPTPTNDSNYQVLENVPNTAKSKPLISLVIGLLFISMGSFAIYYIYRQQNGKSN